MQGPGSRASRVCVSKPEFGNEGESGDWGRVGESNPCRLPMHNKSAVDVDGLACHMSGSIRRQKDDHVGNVLGCLPCSQWDDGADFLIRPFFIAELVRFEGLIKPRLPNRPVQWCPDHTGTNCIDPDSVRCKILR